MPFILKHPGKFYEVVKNRHPVTSASFSPSGNYIASGDIKGNVLVWAVDNEEHAVKHELRPLSGRVNGIAWDRTSSRLAVVGEGREKFGCAMLLSTQSTIGSISSHAKTINSVSYSQEKLQLVATASDDCTVALYSGPPFKTDKIFSDHKMFVYCVKFSPDSKFFASCGVDGILNIYKSAPDACKVASLDSSQYSGSQSSLYCLSWSKDGANIITSSALGCTHLWDVETQTIIRTMKGPDTDFPKNQHVACLYLDDRIVTMSLSQEISYFDPMASEPFFVIKGHKGPINAIYVDPYSKIYTAGSQGVVQSWMPDPNELIVQSPSKRANFADIAYAVHANNGLIVASDNDSISYFDFDSNEFTWTAVTPGRPRKLVYDHNSNTCIAIVSDNILCFLRDGSVTKSVKLSYDATSIALSLNLELIAIGSLDNTVRIYDYSDDLAVYFQPEKITLLKNRAAISCVEFSPDSMSIAVGDNTGKILVYDVKAGTVIIKDWVNHTSRISCIKWSPNSKLVATSSLDTTIQIWSVNSPKKYLTIKPAHTGFASCLTWISDNKIASAGHDGIVKAIRFVSGRAMSK